MLAMHVAHSMQFFHIDFSIIFSFSHLIDIFYELFTVKSHRYRVIDVARNIRELWDTMMLSDHDVICTLVNIALLKHKILVSWCIFYSILNIRSHIDALLHEETQNVFNHSIARLTIRSYVIFEVNKSSNFDSFVSAFFASNLSRWKSLLESFRQRIAEKTSKLIVEKVCTKASEYASLRELLISKSTSLKKL